MEISSYRNIWKVAYPIIAGSIAQNIINVVDTVFLSRLGEETIGAAGNAIIFYYIFIVCGMGFAIGGEIIVGRRNGEGNLTAIGRITENAFYSFLLMASILFVTLKIWSDDLLGAFTSNEIILQKSIEFLDYRLYGIFFAFTNLGYRVFYIGTTRTKVLTVSTAIMAAVNIVLDYALIFGHFGMPELGLKGAALASVIAEAAGTIYFTVFTYHKVDLKKYGLFEFRKPDFNLLKKIYGIASPMMLQSFMAVASWMIFFLIIEKMGSRELAISHIVRSIYMVLMIPLFGFSAATNTLVSNLIGAGKYEDVLKLTKKVIVLTVIATAIILPFNLLIPEKIFSIYTSNPDLVFEGVQVLHVVTVAMFFFSIAYVMFSAVSGSGNTRVSMFIEFFTLMIYLSGAVYFAFVLNGSLVLVWCSEFVYFTSMGVMAFLYLKFGKWKNKVI